MRVLVKDMSKHVAGEEIELCGWVHRLRELGGLTFIILRDRSGLAQLVMEEKLELGLEYVVTAAGIVESNHKAPGGFELKVKRLNILAAAEKDLPFQINSDPAKTSLDIILDKRVLSLRNPKIRAIFYIQSTIIEAFSSFLRAKDFTEIKTSKLIASGTEGGTGLFELEYFDKKLYLAQSPQFYKQTMVASGMERVFEVAHAYRAEKHDTPRHLNEYVSMDLEMAFIDSELDLIELEKELLAYIFEELRQKQEAGLVLWNAVLPKPESIAKAPIISHDEALEVAVMEAGQGSKKQYEISPETERLVCAWAARETGSELVFINDFPRRQRPFYAYPQSSGSTMSFDAIFRGLEITTGGRRQENYKALLESLPRFGLNAEELSGYLDVFKYGCPPHGGFAIGCERLTQKILGLGNVKEASLFPRDRKRVSP